MTAKIHNSTYNLVGEIFFQVYPTSGDEEHSEFKTPITLVELKKEFEANWGLKRLTRAIIVDDTNTRKVVESYRLALDDKDFQFNSASTIAQFVTEATLLGYSSKIAPVIIPEVRSMLGKKYSVPAAVLFVLERDDI